MHDQHDRHVRTTIPATWATKLAHLAADLGVHRHELLREGLVLLLRYHGHGDGLPEPGSDRGKARRFDRGRA